MVMRSTFASSTLTSTFPIVCAASVWNKMEGRPDLEREELISRSREPISEMGWERNHCFLNDRDKTKEILQKISL